MISIPTRLGAMFFVQNLVWGAQVVLLSGHLDAIGFNGREIGYALATSSLGAIVSPLLAGWLADRYLPAQNVAGVCYLAGAPLLWLAWQQAEFAPLWGLLFLYSLLHTPAMSVLNAVALRNLPDRRSFGRVRVWGSIGWVSISWTISLYLRMWEGWEPQVSHLGDGLLIASGLSVVMGIYSFTLPHTPSQKSSGNPLGALSAFRFLRQRSFAVLMVTAFLTSAMSPFSYNFAFVFFTDADAGTALAASTAGLVLSLAQLAELPLMPLLGAIIIRIGLTWTIGIGVLVQGIRFLAWAVGEPLVMLVMAQAAGGVFIVCFIVAATIAVDQLCPAEERASAQGLLFFAMRGFGPLMGHLFAGQVYDYFTLADGTHQWGWIFSVPAAISLFAAVGFVLAFREPNCGSMSDSG
ncbi:MAG: MFS transporter [Candidatus Latescibacterota bacterium]|nr:MFS transporter [Candidatus Latescibacterota bacterium]